MIPSMTLSLSLPPSLPPLPLSSVYILLYILTYTHHLILIQQGGSAMHGDSDGPEKPWATATAIHGFTIFGGNPYFWQGQK